jgi:hypothetical protein
MIIATLSLDDGEASRRMLVLHADIGFSFLFVPSNGERWTMDAMTPLVAMRVCGKALTPIQTLFPFSFYNP